MLWRGQNPRLRSLCSFCVHCHQRYKVCVNGKPRKQTQYLRQWRYMKFCFLDDRNKTIIQCIARQRWQHPIFMISVPFPYLLQYHFHLCPLFWQCPHTMCLQPMCFMYRAECQRRTSWVLLDNVVQLQQTTTNELHTAGVYLNYLNYDLICFYLWLQCVSNYPLN